jgi:EAL domain-containing protein (putative c-di-GMP-specific phosphodiesterase class I)
MAASARSEALPRIPQAAPSSGAVAVNPHTSSLPRPLHRSMGPASRHFHLIRLGESLGSTVAAEGVETEDQRPFLAEHGCTRQQGDLLGRPTPLGEFSSSLP